MKRGEVATLGRHRLMCGDATNADDMAELMEGVTADMLFTDPPYGVSYRGGRFNAHQRESLVGDTSSDLYRSFLPVALVYVHGPCYLWYAALQTASVYQAVLDNRCVLSAMIIWHKTNATYAALGAQYKLRHECCLYFRPRQATLRWCGPCNERTVWEIKRDPRNIYHPTQKPVALAQRALNNHRADTVLDCFAGSGSTLIAAEMMRRTAYCMEISPDYCQVIIDRYRALTGEEVSE